MALSGQSRQLSAVLRGFAIAAEPLPASLLLFLDFPYNIDNGIKRKRFFEKIKGAVLHRLNRRIDRAVAGHHNDIDSTVEVLDGLQGLNAVHAREARYQEK